MNLHSSWKLGTVALASVALLAACGSKAADNKAKDKTINVAEASNLPSMDISKATDVVSGKTLNNTNEGLLKFGKNSSLHPAVAKSWTVSKDGKTYTYKLRQSKWSNGDPVTAQDFVYSWRRTVSPKTASQYAYLFDSIENAKSISSGKMAPSTLGIKALDKYTVQVKLAHAQSYFNELVANPEFYPQNQRVVEKYGKQYGTTSSAMVYNGPFKLTGWTGTNDTWTMVKNKSYWNAKSVKLNKVKFWTVKDNQTALSQYQTGKLDTMTLSSTQVKQYKNNPDYVLRPTASTFYIEMNEKKDPIFKNVKARQAISAAIDRDQFVNKVLADGSTAAKGLVPTKMQYQDGKDFASVAYQSGTVSYDLTKAKKLWQEALKESGQSSLSLNLLSDDTPAGKLTTEFLQDQLQKLPGLKITNQNLPFKTRLARSEEGNFDLVVTAWGADYPDASSFLDLFAKGNSLNNGKWSNSEYDDLVNKADVTDATDKKARFNDMVQADQLINQQAGVVPLYQQANGQLVKSNVKGIIYFPTGAQWDYSQAYLTK
ncbi:peptide ABC transporter substrate-binding protein [Levilactobacillus bambusae]|uniref:Peptide ABC transporter substrate-binding protein n=1 Tax=Levilactobacillus bambusae TaxID=2024736 RepID=A0A2V1N0Y3_9LACO|nr:peptide ABC transporter substrate-binding protein [Levilactobacillus bambusae]PWG00036.1 peptide ABC transporter substrate-binding protein [Levilactobacillus bambusae]